MFVRRESGGGVTRCLRRQGVRRGCQERVSGEGVIRGEGEGEGRRVAVLLG